MNSKINILKNKLKNELYGYDNTINQLNNEDFEVSITRFNTDQNNYFDIITYSNLNYTIYNSCHGIKIYPTLYEPDLYEDNIENLKLYILYNFIYNNISNVYNNIFFETSFIEIKIS